jgi:hypothetical protein
VHIQNEMLFVKECFVKSSESELSIVSDAIKQFYGLKWVALDVCKFSSARETEAGGFSETLAIIYWLLGVVFQNRVIFAVTNFMTSNFAADTALREMLRYIWGRPSFRRVHSERPCSNLWHFASQAAKCQGFPLAVPQVEILPPENKK